MFATRDPLTVPPSPVPDSSSPTSPHPIPLTSLHTTLQKILSREFTSSTETDEDIRTWFQNVEQHATEGVHKILIGNKCDWTEKRVVSEEQGRALARELGVPFMETSAKANINVEDAFFSLAR